MYEMLPLPSSGERVRSIIQTHRVHPPDKNTAPIPDPRTNHQPQPDIEVRVNVTVTSSLEGVRNTPLGQTEPQSMAEAKVEPQQPHANYCSGETYENQS